jgi:C4-dicarboxylate-specific signal transduction histidine kinase
VVWPDGSVHWVVARGRYQYDDAGKAVRLNGFVMDIDRRRTAEQTAREQRDQLAHLLRLSLLNQLASGLAHEINQPLMAIANFSGAALQMHASGTLTPERCREVMTEVHQQSQRAGEIVRRLRGFMARRPAAQARDCALAAVVADALALMRAEVAAKRVRTRVELAEHLPAVRIDPVQIQQVLVNLIQNAADAMDDTPPRDRLITVSTVGSADQVIVRVADTGKGIDPADLPKLFDSFFSTKSYGMGLGLNISRSIIEAHGGTLTAANNADGRGATFEFLLPLEGPA